MGKLTTEIILKDNFSKQLNKINNSIERTASAMARLQQAQLTSSQLIRMEQMKLATAKQQTRAEVERTLQSENKLRMIEEKRKLNAEQIAGKLELQNKALELQQMKYQGIMGQMRLWASRLRNILTIYYAIRGAIQGINAAVKLSDKMTMNDAKLNLVAGGNKKLKNELEAKAFGAAQRSTTDYLEFTKAVGKLGILAGDKFKNNDSIVRFVELMNKSFQISGAETSERNAAMLQITQAIASNRLQGDEFRSILENAPMVMEALTKSLGVGHDKLKAMAKEGEITADVLIKAMFDAGSKIEEMYKRLPMTWERHWAKLKNVGVLAFKPIQEQLSRLFNSKKFQAFINGICNAMIVLGNLGGKALKGLFDLFGWVADKCVQFKSVLLPIVYVIGALTLATLAYYATVGLVNIVIGVWKALKAAIMAVTSAQWWLNIAMAANPIGLVIFAIVLLIALFYGAVKAINHFCGTSISATGIIAGAFMYLVANIYNLFAYLWNFIASWVEFFANVFKHPVYSIKKLFVNLASNVIDACIAMTKGWDGFATSMANAMIDAVNFVIKAWNKLIDLLPDTVVTKLGLGKGETLAHRTSITSDLENAKASLQGLLGDAPSDYWTAPTMQYMTLGDAWDKGYDWGSNLGSDLSSQMDDLTKATLGGQKLTADALNGMSDKLGDVGTNTGNTAKNTGDIAKNTGSTEDYSYLRTWAYQSGLGNSIGYNIKIEQNNKNNIGSNMDLNRVIDAVRDAIIEGITIQAEGV